jgi:hypothetical protein
VLALGQHEAGFLQAVLEAQQHLAPLDRVTLAVGDLDCLTAELGRQLCTLSCPHRSGARVGDRLLHQAAL